MSLSEADTPSDALRIRLFGPIEVRIDGQPLPLMRSRKALWLLALLALRHERAVERAWLAGILWPEVEQTRAFSNLRPILSELRRALGSQAHRLQSPDRFTLRLDLVGTDVDVRAFDTAIASRNLAALEAAIALYRGTLLEGCTEEWVFQDRARREQDCLQALQTLGDAALKVGDDTGAVGYYRRAVELDPWREVARRGLMEALARTGDRNAALQVYREYAALLHEMPGMAPDDETNALYTRLRSEAAQPLAPRAVAAPAPSVSVIVGYLPHALTTLIGREEERIDVADCLRRSRLVTLTGVGGIGKTRLALALSMDVMREYADGVWLAALEALSEEQQVFAQIASVLGVKEEGGRPLPECVTEHLRRKRLLLVLDNCEHLLAACAEVAAHLLKECAEVSILATSREALGISGETAWTVPSLPTPDPAHLPESPTVLLRALMGYESVQLFVARARAVQKSFDMLGSSARTVAQICARLEGIPLAIELAAAQVRVLTVEQIAARLNDHLGLLTGGHRTTQARRQTLRAMLDWSYALLTEAERLLLQRLSVFAGGWTLEAAEAVCTDSEASEATEATPNLLKRDDILPLLTALVDKSLVIFAERDAQEGGRFRMLEMVRQFAGERLAADGEASLLMKRHQDWFITLAEEALPHLRGAEQAKWLVRLAIDNDNLRASLARSEQGAGSAESALRLACALRLFWYIRGDYTEGRQYLRQTLAHRDAQARTSVRATALNGLAGIVRRQSDYAAAQRLYEESLAIRREQGDSRAIAETLGNLGMIRHDLGDYAAARTFYEESLSLHRQSEERHGVALMLANLAATALNQGDFAAAKGLLEESLLIHRELGDRFRIAWALNNLGNVYAATGDLIRAQTQYEESLVYLKELGDRNGIASTCNFMGTVAFRQGDAIRAQAFYEEGLRIFRDLGGKTGMALSLQGLGDTAFEQEECASARALYAESLAIFRELGQKREIAWMLLRMGRVAYAQRDDAEGWAFLGDALMLFKELEEKMGLMSTLEALASAVRGHDAHSAAYLWGAAGKLRGSIGAVMARKEQEKYERHLGESRAAMGEDAFDAAREAGRALTWEQAVDYVLEIE